MAANQRPIIGFNHFTFFSIFVLLFTTLINKQVKVLKEHNYLERINSYTMEDWKPLLKLIPEIEKVEQFGDDTEAMELLEQGILDMEPYDEHEIVERFREVIYSIPIAIDFNWPGWDEGREMVSNEYFDYDTVDIPTKCKVITAIARSDRFSSGALVNAFESGLILKLLKSIEFQLFS